MNPERNVRRGGVLVLCLVLAWLGRGAAFGTDLGSAQLRIAGSRLAVTPESQAVPFDTPTVVETHLEGYDPAHGVLPRDLRVLADFTGPEIDGILVLETLPNQPFRIPRLRLEGEYRLDNIRLVQGEELLGYAEPRSAAVAVTQILITRVTSRALTLDEIRAYGIVVDDDSFQAFNFTFAFAVAGETINYNVPVVYTGPARDQETVLWSGTNFEAPPWRSTSARFEPPRMAPFQLKLAPLEGPDASNGGCDDPEGDCRQDDVVPIPGVILFPTDIGLLHQFFSVSLLAQNGAPPGSHLVLRDLTARVTLPPGLRQAETEPPTPLGVPVPIRVPGPDGILGTGDDLTFLVAQASGKAEALVEGLREGTHVVRFDLEGVLEGLPGGAIRRVTGQASGAVIVRDPSLNVTITHPDTVRTDEEYAMLLTVTNSGTAPANLLSIRLPTERLSGVTVVGENEKTVTIAPGDSELVEFRLLSHRTGRVTSTAVRSSNAIHPEFELTVGVGENGIPLSPNAIILPRATGSLPPDLVRQGLNLIGLGFSLATAPASLLRADLPRVSRATVDSRVYELAQAGKHITLGEEPFDSLTQLAVEWSGGRDADWEWDRLRRTTQKGARVGALVGSVLAAEASSSSPEGAFERFGRTATRVAPVAAVLASGAGLRLEVASRTSGARLSGSGEDAARRRELPFGDLYSLGSAQLALLAMPEVEGYEARFLAAAAVSGDLHLLLPAAEGAEGTPRRVRWPGVILAAGGRAKVVFRPAGGSFDLDVDADGDGAYEASVPGIPEPFARRPFELLAARQDSEIDPTGHVVDVLFSGDIDPTRLFPPDPRHFTIPGKVSNGGGVKAEQDAIDASGNNVPNLLAGMRNARVVRVVFNNPLSPYTEQLLTASGLYSRSGEPLAPGTVEVQTPGSMPGTLVEGKVYGSDGEPVPFAEVVLRESDRCLFCEEGCRTHKTAVVRADAAGSYLFDYVRQTSCGDGFLLEATDAATGRTGSATGRARFIGQRTKLDVVMLGRGSIRGRVTWDDGVVPARARVAAYSPVFREGRSVLVDASGNYALTEVPVGTITLSATDGEGRYTVKTVEIPEAGSVITRDLVILRGPGAPQASGDVRGTVIRPDGTPVAGAYVALYFDGSFVGSRRSGGDGGFDFGKVPAGQAEIESFEGETGVSGGQIFFEVHPDQVNTINPILRDDRGVVQGHVYRQTAAGAVEPLFGIVVWAEGTPFHTVTGADGSFRLDGVFAGTRTLFAADLARKLQVGESITVTAGGQVVERNLYFREATTGGIAGEVLDLEGRPVSGATVHLAVGDQNWFKTATTDPTGRFLIPDLAPGGYSVHGFKGSLGAFRGTTVRFPGDTPFVSLRFKRGTLRGVVKAENDSGAQVGVRSLVVYRTSVVRLEMVGLDLQSHTLETAADGTFEIPDVLAGPYVLSVANAFYGDRTLRGELYDNGEVKNHTFLFERHSTGTVGGVVLEPDGVTPVPGAEVKLRHPAFSDYEVTTDAQGRFRFELVPPQADAFRVEVNRSSGVVFRTAEAWVRLTQGGQDLDLEVVLPKQGSVAGTVVDSNGAAVPGALVTLQEGSYPRRRLVANSDGEGAFAFQNVFAGTLTLAARAPALGGLGGKTTVQLVNEAEALDGVVIALEPTGKIAGRITTPVDGSAVASAEVRLLRGTSLYDTVTADPSGQYELTLLPLGSYTVRAFDPRTGRLGQADDLQVTANNQVVQGDILLQARGSVGGHLYEAGSTTLVPGATLRLQTLGIESFWTYSSTGIDGAYEFEGIPQGGFYITGREPQGRRRVSARGEITSEGQQLTLDLTLEALVTLFGSVLNPPGAPAGLFSPANTVLTQDGQVVGSSIEGTYSFPGLVVGHHYELRTTEIGGGTSPHWGEVLGHVDVAPADGRVNVDIQVHAVGNVSVDVVDAGGAPVPGAKVDLWTDGPYDWGRYRGDTGANGSIVFPRLQAGKLSAYANHPLTNLRGSKSGYLSEDGVTYHLQVRLESSAQLHGTVLKADGATPAAGARISVQCSGRFLSTLADEAGAFILPSIPLGSYLLIATEDLGPGSREVRGDLAANGQDLDLGTLVLDDTDPRLVAIEPGAGALDVPLIARPLVRFSEPVDPSRGLNGSIGGSIHLETPDSQWVSVDMTFEEGGAAVRLAPRQPLRNFTSYRLRIHDMVYDLAGRKLDHAVEVSFNTADQVGPSVIESAPVEGARQVALASAPRVMFSEPVAPASLNGAALILTDTTSGAGQTVTYQLDAAGRTVTVNPIAGLANGHRYRLSVQGVTDPVGNAMAAAFQLNFQALDTQAPEVLLQQPAAGAAYTSGARIAVAAAVTDPSAIPGVTLRLNGRSYVDTAAPYAWDIPAPLVATAQNLDLSVEVADEWGNQATATRSLHVEPRTNAQAPTLERSCWPAGAVPGAPLAFPFVATDDEGIESYRLKVDGQLVATVPVDAALASVTAEMPWTVPSAAATGVDAVVRIEAVDFAGNVGFTEAPLPLRAGDYIASGRALDASLAGRALVLAAGSFPLPASLQLSALTLLPGAHLTAPATGLTQLGVEGRLGVGCTATVEPSGGTAAGFDLSAGDLFLDGRIGTARSVDLTVAGTLRIGPAGRIVASAGGYAGGVRPAPTTGSAPAGVTAAESAGGGSHGGSGTVGSTVPGSAGSIFDSVARPVRAGGGGGIKPSGPGGIRGGAGGGVVRIQAGSAEVLGSIEANGETRPYNEAGGGGGGGTVWLQAGVLAGGGTIGASGGDGGGCGAAGGGGGGGRIALDVQSFSGFDPTVQVKAWGGVRAGCGGFTSSDRSFAAPGTVYLSESTSTYGRLLVDSGQESGVDRRGLVTELPALGSGAVTSWTVEGADAWLGTAVPEGVEVVGSWVSLRDAAGSAIGSGFRVAEVDAQGRMRLTGAGALSGVSSFTGEYRFDAVDLRHGAGLHSASPISGSRVELQGENVISADVEAISVVVRAGALVRPGPGSELRFKVAGKMTVEAGARIAANGTGFAGGIKSPATAAGAPAGVAGAQSAAGGSHGAGGGVGSPVAGTPGSVFDSIAMPILAGGGGGISPTSLGGTRGGAGGGVVRIEAGELELLGSLEAVGETRPWNESAGGGAGGTVSVQAGVLRGTGTIDASGGDAGGCNAPGGAGAGGRVSLQVETFAGFDAATQVKAWSGTRAGCGGYEGTDLAYSAPGTIFSSDAGSTYGRLRVDAGQRSGVDRQGTATELPALAAGAVAAWSATGPDAWLTASFPLGGEAAGSWVDLRDTAGTSIGSGFRVLEIDSQGRALLAGAGGVTGAASFASEYRFDAVDLLHGAGLRSVSPVRGGDFAVSGSALVDLAVQAASVTVKPNAVIRPGASGELRFDVQGVMSVETGARLVAVGTGFAGGLKAGPLDGAAPAGVSASQPAHGGSHGGVGQQAYSNPPNMLPGEVFDSLYQPALGGGGGAARSDSAASRGGAGGGVIRIQAGELALQGTLEAGGAPSQQNDWTGGGAGGTVRVEVGTLRGSGTIDASGANNTGCHNVGGPGGGGRILLAAQQLVGFDPATQARAVGGGRSDCNGPLASFAAPGTLLTRVGAQAYGDLRVDQGLPGSSTQTVPQTVLPTIGQGTVGAIEPDASAPTAVWITPLDAAQRFGAGVDGAWLRLRGVDYRLLAVSTDRRKVLVAGAAGAVAAGDLFSGIYKLDGVTVAGRARLSVADGLQAGTSTVASGSDLTYLDLDAPVLVLQSPAAGASYSSGDAVAVAATASDASGVASVTFHLGDRSFTDTAAPYEWTVPAPRVGTASEVLLTVEALDSRGNLGTASRSVHVDPAAPGAAPAISVGCLTPSILLAPGTSLSPTLSVSHAAGIDRVELYLGDDLVWTDFDAPYSLTLAAPADALDGSTLAFRVRATSFSGTTSELELPVRVVTGTVLTTDRTVGSADSSLDGGSVIVAAGTLVVSGAHAFRDLVVLDGGRVAPAETTSSAESKLDLSVQRDVYVSCGGRIEADGRGYLGAATATVRGFGYPNNQTEGAAAGVAGSHGGRGGRFDGSSPVYDSFFDPLYSGAGGGYSAGKGRDGGGAIRITALGTMTIDGSVTANGEAGTLGAGGAGGSIRLNGAELKGAGLIRAQGSPGATGIAGGAGGRIALYVATLDAGLLARTSAAGAATSSTDASTWGAAGTIFVKPDGQAFGDLIVDNGGAASLQLTELPAAGSGVVDAVSSNGFTDNEADFANDLRAVEIYFNGNLGTLYAVQSHAHHGASLTLAVPTPPLSSLVHAGDTYGGIYRFHRLVVRGGARALALDRVTSELAAEVAADSTWTESYAPTVQLTSPEDGATVHPGDAVVVSADAVDLLGVREVELRLGSGSGHDTAAPYSWTFTAPEVQQSTVLPISATALDLSGHKLVSTRMIHVVPLVDLNTPVVKVAGCPSDGDLVLPGVALSIPYTATDNVALASITLVINGTTVQTVTVSGGSASGILSWTPPSNAAAGSVFEVRVEARDTGGTMGVKTLTLTTPLASALAGPLTLDSSRNGQSLVLKSGTFTVNGAVSLAALTLAGTAKIVPTAGQTLDLAVTGSLRVQCGTSIDVSANGYAGATTANSAGTVPAGVTPSSADAGGSHGGVGALGNAAGPTGEVYDSAYLPALGGGGGSKGVQGTQAGKGGGILRLSAASVLVDGTLRSQGEQRSVPYGQSDSSGAGGTILVTAGSLAGVGTIEASGGEYNDYYYYGGSGGGGRIALVVDTLNGFDPSTQTKAWGGAVVRNSTSNVVRYAGPGTVYVKQASETYGRLIVDSGKLANGTERSGPVTPLPLLGTGSVTAFSPAGADAWVTGPAAFKAQWLGAWMALDNSAGAALGSYRVLSIDGQGRALLSNAGSLTGVAQYRGQYRFDRLDLKAGAGLAHSDDLVVGTVVAEPKTRLPGTLSASSVTVKAGAAVTPAQGGLLLLSVSGKMTIEAGAVLDVSATGYPGAATSNGAGGAPAGVAPSSTDGGGSHGGVGALGNTAGPAGEVFDSVYEPRLGGGGGSKGVQGTKAGSGGGTLILSAGEVQLDGTLRSQGEQRSLPYGQSDSSGAGGSILVTAGSLSGAGTIEASGGDYNDYYYYGGSGGGGRIALLVDTFNGFDPATQAKAWGGTVVRNSTSNVVRYAGPGTVFVKQASETYGRLIVDSGKLANGTERSGPVTPLPPLGNGAVSAFTAAGSDAWVTGPAAFKNQWLGAWMALEDGSGATLGSYRVLSIDGQGRALLANAGSLSGVPRYRGQYRFDRLDLKAGAGLTHSDELVVGTVVAEPKTRLPGTLSASSLTVKAGSAVTPAQGGLLQLSVSGRLTIEAGAVLDASATGYAGATTSNGAGTAPAGVTPSSTDAGGSHGGAGSLGNAVGPAGEVFDSVYQPKLGGGGGSKGVQGTKAGSGGGTLILSAGEVQLDGTLRSQGEQRSLPYGQSDSSGAGGSILVTAGSLSGAGTIEASGGDYNDYYYYGGSGGGGRIALLVDTLNGFDPATQAKAWGGTVVRNSTSNVVRYAGPGTIFVKQASETYGRLIVDSGKLANGTERSGPATPLPPLGNGAVSAFTAAGSDAWATGPAAFKGQWLGAWMALEDGAGATLGSYRVLSIDGQGRALLSNAGSLSGVARYRGQYRFDRLDLRAGAGLTHSDELLVGTMVAEPKTRLPEKITASSLTVKAGSAVTLAQGGLLQLSVSGKLTIEAGAVLDASATGFAGATTSNSAGTAPALVTPSSIDAGGSHGGVGSLGNTAGPAGEVFDSAYQPKLGGGGGSRGAQGTRAGNGGGTVILSAGEVQVDGVLRSQGEQRSIPYGQSDSSGAGGTILVLAGTLSGSGTIEASGGDYNDYYSYGGSGGGGRIALLVDALSGFDPSAQAKARGGAVVRNSTSNIVKYASPGTVFVKLPSQTYGKLYVDQGGISGKPIVNTPLPSLGTGTLGTVTVDVANTTALWVEPADPNAKFALGAPGMWLRVDGADYRVLDQSADRRKLLLQGAAATVTSGLSYRGVYKFDEVVVKGGAKLEFRDTNLVTTFTVDATSSVIQNVP